MRPPRCIFFQSRHHAGFMLFPTCAGMAGKEAPVTAQGARFATQQDDRGQHSTMRLQAARIRLTRAG